MISIGEALKRVEAMHKVKEKAKELLREYAGNIETSKPEIVSNLTEFALEEAGIRVKNVIVWDQGSIDVEFGKLLFRKVAGK